MPAPDPSVIPAIDLRARTADGFSYEQLMTDLLPAAQRLAIAPVSGFRVGAVAQGISGTLYLGANLEFPGMPLTASVHAEQAAVSNAWHHGETGIKALAVTAAPCGYCRQFLNELESGGALRVLVAGAQPVTLADLLPAAFGPRDLGLPGGLLQPAAHRLITTAHMRAGEPGDLGEEHDRLVATAIQAAAASYAPYSMTYAGVALALADGSVQSGRYAENAAFNPSLLALPAALSGLAVRSIPISAIRRAVLVEADGSVSQRAATEALLAAVAPKVPLAYVRAVKET
jgi:cytidine deaminase